MLGQTAYLDASFGEFRCSYCDIIAVPGGAEERVLGPAATAPPEREADPEDQGAR